MVKPFRQNLSNVKKLKWIKKWIFCVTQIDEYGKLQLTMIETHILSRYCMRYVMEIFFSKEVFSVDYQKLFNYYTSGSRKNLSIRRQIFILDCFMSHKTDPLKFLFGVQRHMIKISNWCSKVVFSYSKIRVLVFQSIVISIILCWW